jgi:ATP/maltotriose-dependent transcriptional regulator MalT
MPEPQNSSSSGQPNQPSAGLLVTKFGLPRLRPGLLPRFHLIDRLEEVTTRELVLVSTPPGFGKTTLLAGWARSTERPVAWLSLGRGDNDPVRFWRYIVAAVEKVHHEIGGQARSLLNASPQPNTRAVVTAIALTTAKKHVSNIIGKLGVSNRTQAVSRG